MSGILQSKSCPAGPGLWETGLWQRCLTPPGGTSSSPLMLWGAQAGDSCWVCTLDSWSDAGVVNRRIVWKVENAQSLSLYLNLLIREQDLVCVCVSFCPHAPELQQLVIWDFFFFFFPLACYLRGAVCSSHWSSFSMWWVHFIHGQNQLWAAQGSPCLPLAQATLQPTPTTKALPVTPNSPALHEALLALRIILTVCSQGKRVLLKFRHHLTKYLPPSQPPGLGALCPPDEQWWCLLLLNSSSHAVALVMALGPTDLC